MKRKDEAQVITEVNVGIQNCSFSYLRYKAVTDTA